MGNEWDWLGFFYNVNTQTGNRFSLSDLASVYRIACTGSASSPCTRDLLTGLGPLVFFNKTAPNNMSSIPHPALPDGGGGTITVVVPPGTFSLANSACRYVNGGSCDLTNAKFKYFRDTGITYGIDH